MKKIIIIAAIVSLSSCKKDSTIEETQSKVFVRVESVSKTGQSTYSKIKTVNVK